MKQSLNLRTTKMILHLVSISIFSIPITTHILVLSLNETFSIYNYQFRQFDSILLICLILAIISANIISIVTNRWHKISLLITGGFLFTITIIQISLLSENINMEVFGTTWPHGISLIEASITGTFSALFLLTAAYIKADKPQSNDQSGTTLHERIKHFLDYVKEMDRKLAFLFGIVCSLLLATPICGLMYLVANFFLGEPVFVPTANEIVSLDRDRRHAGECNKYAIWPTKVR